ncbi:2-hydroxyacid dehydrogenase [Bosea sp. 685]|uniref:2-hydroxyacid dehydrogenase n=1 Tax=Bosea sp. 685 TaxID=3080057 RepID=UPI002892E67F|nr:2-hydroxyacid dehydrogenase [Bosea sp. 685]WNJ90811.1 2-hydroxyacid dehydrogenase [Bosea sp. 685]
MKPTILMAPRMPARLVERLQERYVLLGPMEHSTPDALPEGAEAAQALLTMGSLTTDATLIDALPKLGLISCYGTGIEGVDRACAKARGIKLSNAADANATSVAEFAMGLLLASARRIGAAERFVRAGRWQGNSVQRMANVPGLAGRKLGIYGLGAIGARVASRAAAFDMTIGYHNRSQRRELPYLYHDSLLGLASWADVLIVAVRASIETRHAINAQVLRALGPEGHLINISRGIAVDEEALCEALETNLIAGAALDVYEHEPQVPDRLKVLENVVLTPHIAANAESAQIAQQDLLLGNLEAYFAGKPLLSPVVL